MSDRINILNRVDTVDVAPQFTNYSKVRILVGQNESGEEVVYEAGDDFGRTLELQNPFGTQAMANRILQKLRGFQYQPYRADGALLDPAAELGDAISSRGIYGGIYNLVRDFSRLMKANIAAPHDEEIDHEYKYETSQERKYRREVGGVRATLTIQGDQIAAEVTQRKADSAEFRSQFQVQATQIAAKVSQTGGNNASFGWSLKATEFGLYSGNKKVFYVNSGGAHVQGEITATSGKIGNFNIGSTAIWNNISQYGGSQSTGVYLGTNGIQLGQSFFVDTWGNVTAKNLTVTGGKIKIGPNFEVDTWGNVTAANLKLNGGQISIGGNFNVDQYGNLTANSGSFRGNVSAGNIQYGGNYGTFDAGGLSDGSIGWSKYGSESIGSGAIGGGAVINSKIGNSAVSYGKVDFTGTLDQVGTNKSNIEAMYGYFTGSATFSNLKASVIWLDGKSLYFDSQNYVRGASYD